MEKLLIGVDEVGRGPLCGPVVAAAVYIPSGVNDTGFDDSKKLSKKKRELLFPYIKENCIWGIGEVDPVTIDKINILEATFVAMKKAISDLFERNPGLKMSDFMLKIDGDKFNGHEMDYECVIKGDSKYKCISAASVLAKVHRDEIMSNLSDEFPEYLWAKNSGYGTKEHTDAILRLGLTEHHRKTFCTKFL